MRKFLYLLFFHCLFAANVCAQELTLPADALNDDAALAKSMPELAKRVIEIYQESDRTRRLGLLFRLQITAGQYAEAIKSLQDLSELRRPADPVAPLRILPFEVEARARLRQSAEGIDFNEAFKREFRGVVGRLTDLEVSDTLPWFGGDLNRARNDLNAALEKQRGKDGIGLVDALELIRAYHLFKSFEAWFPLTEALKNEEDSRRYIVERDLLIRTPDNADISH